MKFLFSFSNLPLVGITSHGTVKKISKQVSVCRGKFSLVIGHISEESLTLEIIWQRHGFWKVAGLKHNTRWNIYTLEYFFPFQNDLLALQGLSAIVLRDTVTLLSINQGETCCCLLLDQSCCVSREFWTEIHRHSGTYHTQSELQIVKSGTVGCPATAMTTVRWCSIASKHQDRYWRGKRKTKTLKGIEIHALWLFSSLVQFPGNKSYHFLFFQFLLKWAPRYF